MRQGSAEFLGGRPVVPLKRARTDAVILYGAGNMGRDLASALAGRGTKVVCFLDRNALPGSDVDGVPVFHPDDERVERAGATVIVSIFNRDASISEVLDDLRRHGYESVQTLLDVYDDVHATLGDRFWLTTRTLYETTGAEIEEASTLWADERSRDLYSRIVEFRLSGNYRLLPAPEDHQYFPESVPAWRNPVRFVDGGAFDGDSVRACLASGISIDALAAFEPDHENYKKLVAFVGARRSSLGSELALFPCALWSETSPLQFAAGRGEGSRVVDGAGPTVQGARLDDALPGFAPTLIKLDVEGAEPEALAGATQTIQEHHPGLAVCVYHRPEHLWTIPLAIRRMSERYKLYLRLHGHSGFELVLYALPRE